MIRPSSRSAPAPNKTSPVGSSAGRTPTPSLRGRVTLAALGLLMILLVVLGTAIDVLLGIQIHRDLHDRLMATAAGGCASRRPRR